MWQYQESFQILAKSSIAEPLFRGKIDLTQTRKKTIKLHIYASLCVSAVQSVVSKKRMHAIALGGNRCL